MPLKLYFNLCRIAYNIISDIHKYKFLWILIFLYSLCILMANLYDARLISLFNVTMTPGVLIYPISFSINLLISEVYHFYFAKKTIIIGFMVNMIVLIYGLIVVYAPIPIEHSNEVQNANEIFKHSFLIIFASFLSYFVSEFSNSFIYLKIKESSKSISIVPRYLFSIFIATMIDTFIFTCVAFGLYLNSSELWHLIMTMIIIKFVIEAILGIFFKNVSQKLRLLEGIKDTDIIRNFSLLRKKNGK